MEHKRNLKVNRADLPKREEEADKKEKKAVRDVEATAPAEDASAPADHASAAAEQPTAKKDAPASKPAAKKTAKRNGKKSGKRLLSKTAKIVLVAIGVLAMVLSVTAMAFSGFLNEATGANSTGYKLTGGVAATVDGINITEDTITKQIMSTRNSGGYTTDKKWAQYLVDQGLTPESYRQQIISSYEQQILISKAVKEHNITVSSSEIDDAYKKQVEQYGGEDSMKSIIKAMGYTEDTYKQSITEQLQQDKLKKEVAPEKTPSDKDILAYFNENIATYNDARRSENLLIKVDSSASDDDKAKAKQKAEDILNKINAGELSFEDAVSQYSEDTGSKDKKGDVGWDKLTSFVTEYQDALSKLSKDQISGVVETTYGYHIIKCTDYFHVDGKADKIDQLPSEIKSYISNVVKTQNQSDAWTKWLEDYTKKATVKVNKMPDDVPYNVSLEGVTKSTDTSAATTGSTAGATDANAGSSATTSAN